MNAFTVSAPLTVKPDRQEAENDRLAELARYNIVDTPPEAEFDRVVELARVLFDAPISAVTLVERDRQWFKAKAGLASSETPRDQSFCSHAIEGNGVFVVLDATADPRFAQNPLVLGDPNIRFYAGAPLSSANGHNLGAMCVISPVAREAFSESDQKKLEALASIVSTGMELRARAQAAKDALQEKDATLREAHFRIKNSLEYADLLAEVQADAMPMEKLAIVAMAAWKQHAEAGGILASAIKSLRSRMPAQDYRNLLDQMPGFGL